VGAAQTKKQSTEPAGTNNAELPQPFESFHSVLLVKGGPSIRPLPPNKSTRTARHP
jgi:hypothetical protein